MNFHATFRFVAIATLFILLAPIASFAIDTVEFLNGSKATGTVKLIRKADKEFDFETKIGTRTFTRTYPFSDVHAVTMKGKRYELTPKSVTGSSEETTRTKAEVQAIIKAAGTSEPDWYASTSLDYPKTLDLAWPLKPPTKGWHSQKNMGQYIWSVVNENPSRWHSGIKLVHHCISLHINDKKLLQRDMQKLGTMYFELLQDYPRAAFWFEKANVPATKAGIVKLAECYWRLGNRDMAFELLQGKTVWLGSIKLYGDMGEIDKALRVVKAYRKSNAVNDAHLHYGDALRRAGRTDEAVKYYQRVIDSDKYRNEDYEKRLKGRARDSIAAIQVYGQLDISKIADGTYQANAIGYQGRLDVEVRVASNRIESVKITQHKEKQYYAAMTDTPNQIINKQSVKDIDATSGATITSQAIVNATAKALAKGAK